MSDILMPGQGGKRSKRKTTTNEVHGKVLELEQNMGQFARAVGNDLQRMQAMLMALLRDLGRITIYDCPKCKEKGIWVPVLDTIDITPDCPGCGEVLKEEDIASDEEE